MISFGLENGSPDSWRGRLYRVMLLIFPFWISLAAGALSAAATESYTDRPYAAVTVSAGVAFFVCLIGNKLVQSRLNRMK